MGPTVDYLFCSGCVTHFYIWNSIQPKIERTACFKTLNIADALLSNYNYPNANKEQIKPGKIITEEVRTCFNELACSCDYTEVIKTLKKIMFEPVLPDIIVDLRNAVRRELEFGVDDFDKDRNHAFIGRISADPELVLNKKEFLTHNP